ncbi:hypothetical protein C1H46_012601 [Malus baccata]|uniref:RING-type E3 ubiquitin transferase n=1 Tax=Malus baccata TaxID=106549 RepID=A0A540MSR8_MALBA|nr:hypothetical protein C1H46_012601 [Malus baccata]
MEEDSFVDSLTTYDGIYEGEDTYHRCRLSCHHRRRFLAPAKSNNRALSPATTVHELLECPVCSKSMFPPIHQLAVNRCPACLEKLGDIPCLALEKVAESLELPCKYCSLGCMEIFPYYIKLRHEAHCNYRPYSCPYPGSDECSEVEDVPFLVDHLREDHKVDLHVGPTFNHLYVKSNRLEVECAARMLMEGAQASDLWPNLEGQQQLDGGGAHTQSMQLVASGALCSYAQCSLVRLFVSNFGVVSFSYLEA